VNSRGLLDRLVPTLLVIISLVLAFFTGFDIARGHVAWSWFEGAATAVGLAVAVPLTRAARRRFAAQGDHVRGGYLAEGDVWAIALQPCGWTKGVDGRGAPADGRQHPRDAHRAGAMAPSRIGARDTKNRLGGAVAVVRGKTRRIGGRAVLR
jgi:hypothetical protein